MRFEIHREPIASLDAYSSVSPAFEVNRICRISEPSPGTFALTEERVRTPHTKDYDTLPDENPTAWPRRFDVSRWELFVARAGRELAGGAILVYRRPDIEMLEGRSDLGVVWDIRVAARHRGQGIGRALLEKLEQRAAAVGCAELKVETQDINADACQLYARLGFVLSRVNRDAYPTLPNESQLIWRKRLAAKSPLPEGAR